MNIVSFRKHKIKLEVLLPEPVLKITSNKLERISLEIQPSNYCKPFNVICWYRTPINAVDNDAFEELREVLIKLDSDKKETILIGDTNCDFKNCCRIRR